MKIRTVILVGAGYTLKRVGKLAATDGFRVQGTRRAPNLEEFDIRAWEGGAFPFTDLSDAIVIYSVPPKETDDPICDLLDLCSTAKRFVYLSSTSVYGATNGAEVDEQTEPAPFSPSGILRLRAEKWVEHASVSSAAIRIAGIYGPGRTLKDYIERGRYTLVNPDKITNRIHVDDLARLIWTVSTLDLTDAHTTVNAADGNPRRVGDLVDFLVQNYQMTRPRNATLEQYEIDHGPTAAARWKPSSHVVPAAARQMGFSWTYPDVFAGYRALLD